MLYAFSSEATCNGSAFAVLAVNILGALAMWDVRFGAFVPGLAPGTAVEDLVLCAGGNGN